jgi:hypothetical protein
MKFNYTKIILVILLLCVSFQQGYSGPRKKLGTTAAPELLIPLGAIGTSLQGSNIAYTSGVDAIYWNPAGLSYISSNSTEIMFSHMNYFADLKMEYVAGGVKVGNLGVLGVTLRNLSFGDPISVTTEYNPEGTGETFSPTYLIGTLSYAKAMTDKVRFGTTVKLISEKVDRVSAVGYAFDFGLQYIAGKSGLTFGIVLKNLGPSMRFDGPGLDGATTINGNIVYSRTTLQDFDLPTTLELGLGYHLTLAKKNNISISSSFQNSGFTSDEYRFGLEYNYNNYVFLRGAAIVYPDKLKDESLFGPSFGAGVQYPFKNGIILGFDYAYRLTNEKGFDSQNQVFTLHVGF